MQSTSSPQRSRISSDQIGEVICDLKLIDNSNAKIFFVVDPFEVVEFCFPIDPDREWDTDIDELADDQAALFEVFYGRNVPAVLLPEYAEEITGHLDFITRRSEEVFSKLEMLESLTRKAELESPEAHKVNSELLEYFQNKFGVVLAVRMGIDSLGRERFLDLTKKLKLIDELQDSPHIQDSIRTYRRSPLADYIYDYLMSDAKNADRITFLRRQRAALRDAGAIDFLLYLNKALERSYSVAKQLNERLVFLYLSSAYRSRRVFAQERVMHSFPSIDGHKHSILRTKSQIFAYAFSKSRVEDESEERKKTIENLVAYKTLVENLEKIEKSPTEYAGSARQELLETLREREADLRGASLAVENLGLFSRIKTYSGLLTNRDTTLGRRKGKAADTIYSEISRVFKEASENQVLEDMALQQKQDLQNKLVIESEFAVRAPRALNTEANAPDQTQEAAEDKSDPADESCKIPTVVRIKEPSYLEIVDLLSRYSKVPASQKEKRASLFSQAYKKFCNLEGATAGSGAPDVNRGEHELVRCIFYLTLSPKSGGLKVNDHAQRQIEQYPELEPEFNYVRCWALGNMGEYAEAERLITTLIAENSSDPRLPLWRALNICAWRVNGKDCPFSMSTAIESTLRALALYEQQGDNARVGLAHNNLAFYYSCDPDDPSFSLTKAREHLELLMLRIKREQWTPDHPEFFHTEANLLFQEFLRIRQTGAEPEALQTIWQEARDAISAASKIVNKPAYGELSRKIKAERPPKAAASRSASTPHIRV